MLPKIKPTENFHNRLYYNNLLSSLLSVKLEVRSWLLNVILRNGKEKSGSFRNAAILNAIRKVNKRKCSKCLWAVHIWSHLPPLENCEFQAQMLCSPIFEQFLFFLTAGHFHSISHFFSIAPHFFLTLQPHEKLIPQIYTILYIYLCTVTFGGLKAIVLSFLCPSEPIFTSLGAILLPLRRLGLEACYQHFFFTWGWIKIENVSVYRK